jgi:RecA-family ATPase
VEPRNFIRSFRRICEEHGIRVITVHHVRHTVAFAREHLGEVVGRARYSGEETVGLQ